MKQILSCSFVASIADIVDKCSSHLLYLVTGVPQPVAFEMELGPALSCPGPPCVALPCVCSACNLCTGPGMGGCALVQ